MDSLREELAAFAHESWCGWMRYLEQNHLDKDCWERWQRQMVTPYSELSEKEKDSDRKEADKIIKILISKS